MNIIDLREAQVRFENRREEIIQERKALFKLRSNFIRYFDRQRIMNMQIDEYVIGVGSPNKGFNFCYALERQLDSLGRMLGATAFKFGVYYGRTKSEENDEYRFTQKFGNNYQEAFEGVKQSILLLLDAGEKGDLDVIVRNPLSPMFKGKILSTYFPERYLNVFSPDHLNYYLTQLDLDTKDLIHGDAVYKREALVEFKNQDPVMKNWSVDFFAHFLYGEYPGAPPKRAKNEDKTSDHLSDYRTPDFPANPKPDFIDLKIIAPDATESIPHSKRGLHRRQPDYEKEARNLKRLGDRGEKIVMDLEKKRLIDAGRKDLAKKIERVSLKSDSYGYDILSFETDGKSRFIEVKATRSDVGPANFFFTANEFQISQESENYFIYMVYNVISTAPKVWAIRNPFKPENRNTIKTPVSFRVVINTTKA
jgi:hypothetical protein